YGVLGNGYRVWSLIQNVHDITAEFLHRAKQADGAFGLTAEAAEQIGVGVHQWFIQHTAGETDPVVRLAKLQGHAEKLLQPFAVGWGRETEACALNLVQVVTKSLAGGMNAAGDQIGRAHV